jgi:hypothetical protein
MMLDSEKHYWYLFRRSILYANPKIFFLRERYLVRVVEFPVRMRGLNSVPHSVEIISEAKEVKKELKNKKEFKNALKNKKDSENKTKKSNDSLPQPPAVRVIKPLKPLFHLPTAENNWREDIPARTLLVNDHLHRRQPHETAALKRRIRKKKDLLESKDNGLSVKESASLLLEIQQLEKVKKEQTKSIPKQVAEVKKVEVPVPIVVDEPTPEVFLERERRRKSIEAAKSLKQQEYKRTVKEKADKKNKIDATFAGTYGVSKSKMKQAIGEEVEVKKWVDPVVLKNHSRNARDKTFNANSLKREEKLKKKFPHLIFPERKPEMVAPKNVISVEEDRKQKAAFRKEQIRIRDLENAAVVDDLFGITDINSEADATSYISFSAPEENFSVPTNRDEMHNWFPSGSTTFSFFESVYSDITSSEQFKSILEILPCTIDILAYFRLLYTCNTAEQYVLVTWQFLRGVYGSNKEIIDSLLDSVKSTQNLWPVWSETLGDTTEYWADRLQTIMDSKLLTTIRNMLLSVVSFSLFSKDSAKTISSYLGKVRPVSLMDFFPILMDCICKVARFGEAMMAGISISDYLESEDPVQTAITKIETLCSYEEKDALTIGLPRDGYMDVHLFIQELTAAQTLLTQCVKLVRKHTPKHLKISNAALKATLALSRVKNSLCGKDRDCPFAIILHGQPGVGKGVILPVFGQWYSEIMGWHHTTSMTFPRVATSDYFDGYDPYQTHYVQYSELFNMSKNLVKKTGDPIVLEMCTMVDTLPLCLDMSSVEQKGVTFAVPKLVVADCNNLFQDIDETVSNAGAVKRRFITIEQVLKPEFRSVNATGINVTKSHEIGGDIRDRYLFTVSRWIPQNMTQAVEDVIACGIDIYALELLMKALYKKHLRQQHLMREVVKTQEEKRITEKAIVSNADIEEEIKRLDDISKKSNRTFIEDEFVAEFSQKHKWGFPDIRSEARGQRRRVDRMEVMYIYFMTMGFFASLASYWNETRKWYWKRTQERVQGLIVWYYLAAFLYNFFMPCITIFGVLSFKYGCSFLSLFLPTSPAKYIGGWLLERKLDQMLSNQSKILGDYLFRREEEFFPLHKKASTTYLKVFGAAASAMLLWKIFKSYTRATASSEAQTQFRIPSEHNEHINFTEELCGATDRVKRIPIKLKSNTWNVMEHITAPPVTKNHKLQVYSSVSKNLRHVRVTGEGPLALLGLGLKGDLILINKHAFQKPNSEGNYLVEVPNKLTFEDSQHTHETIVRPKDLISVSSDCYLLRLNGEMFRDITPYVIPELPKDYGSVPCVIGGVDSRAGRHNGTVRMDGNTPKERYLENGFVYAWGGSGIGKCGTPLVLSYGTGWCLAGIHSGSGAGNSYATTFTVKDIQRALSEEFDGRVMMEIHSEGCVVGQQLVEPASKSFMRYEDLEVRYIGRLNEGKRTFGKSRIRLAPQKELAWQMFGPLVDGNGRPLYGKPHMKPGFINGVWKSPINNAVRSLSRSAKGLNPDILERCVKELVERICTALERNPEMKLAPLTQECAINGIVDDPLTRRVNVNTAAGYGFKGKKGDYLPIVKEDIGLVIREALPALKKEIGKLLEAYDFDETAEVVFNAALKDEPRLNTKNDEAKTRVFYATPLASLILSRQYLSPIFTLVQEMSDLFYAPLGIDMLSESHEFVEELIQFSKFILEGDYKAFDLNQLQQFKLAYSTVVHECLKRFGYNAHALRIARGILSQGMFPTINMFGDVLMCCGFEPSGVYGTTHRNSGVNLLMMMYFWYSITDDDFFKNVLARLCGDDMLASVKEKFVKIFNNVTYQKFCEEHYGIIFTPAQKDSEMQEFLDITQASFLKRNFRYSVSLKRWVAPLFMDSIVRMNTLYLPSKVINEETQVREIITAAVREYFFHCEERQQFDSIRDQFIDWFCKKYVVPVPEVEVKVPTYEALFEIFARCA